jgi:CBS domain-containing protein
VAIDATAPVRVAVRRLTGTGLRRLCVVDDAGRLTGMLSRRDLLRVFLRDDALLQDDIDRALAGRVHSWRRIHVRVTGQVASLDGEISFHSGADQAERLARSVPGFVDVRNALRYDVDDYSYLGP